MVEVENRTRGIYSITCLLCSKQTFVQDPRVKQREDDDMTQARLEETK